MIVNSYSAENTLALALKSCAKVNSADILDKQICYPARGLFSDFKLFTYRFGKSRKRILAVSEALYSVCGIFASHSADCFIFPDV